MSKKKKRKRSTPAAPAETAAAPGFFDRRGTLIVWVLMGLYAAVFITFSLIKYYWFLYNDFDLAIFAQAAHGTMRGSMHSSILGLNYLGSHMSLVMLPIAPVYFIFPHPVTLLVLQTVVLALGALPVYWLARRELKNGFLAVAFAALYLLYPALGYSNLYEFHPITLATTTLLWAFYFLWVGRFWLTTLFAVLSLMAKENVAVVVVMMGLYSLLIRRPRRWLYAATLVGLSLVFLVVSFAVIMPRLNQGQVAYASFYDEWGESMGEAIGNMATHPGKVMQAFFWTTFEQAPGQSKEHYLNMKERRIRTKHQYYVHMLVPVLLLSLASPLTLLISLPAVAQHLLSGRPSDQAIVFHYTALVTPFVLAAAVLGLRNVLRLLTRGVPGGLTDEVMHTKAPPRTLGILLVSTALVASAVCNFLFGPIAGSDVYLETRPHEKKWPDARDRAMAPHLRAMAARLPEQGGIAAGFRFMSRTANRPLLHSIHHVQKGTYTYSTRDFPIPTDVAAAIVDTGDWRYLSYMRPNGGVRLREMVARNRLKVVDAAGAAVLLLQQETPPGKPFEMIFDVVDFAPGGPDRARFDDASAVDRTEYNGMYYFLKKAQREKIVRAFGKRSIEAFDGLALRLAYLGHDRTPASAAPGDLVAVRTYWQRLDRALPPSVAEEAVVMPIRLLLERHTEAGKRRGPEAEKERTRLAEEIQSLLKRAGITTPRSHELFPRPIVYYLAEIVLEEVETATEVVGVTHHMGYTFNPVHDWTPGQTVRQTTYFPVPTRVHPGTYKLLLWVRVTDRKGTGIRIQGVRGHRDAVPLGTIRIAPAEE